MAQARYSLTLTYPTGNSATYYVVDAAHACRIIDQHPLSIQTFSLKDLNA